MDDTIVPLAFLHKTALKPRSQLLTTEKIERRVNLKLTQGC
jgi:hypothetical protein